MGLVAVELDQGERIGFLSGRGFNPVFALIEAAWMISGRNDLQSLQNVIRNFGKFSDDGNTLNGAYGYRLRHEFNVDQIDAAVIELNRTADSRRVVLSIYGAQDVGSNSNDIPCNTQVLLRIVPDGHPKLLHLWPPKLPQAGRPNYRRFGLAGSGFLSW